MTNPEGSFIWYELMTADPDAASEFYGAVIGWRVLQHSDASAGGMDYRLIQRDDGGMAGGMLTLTPEMQGGGASPCWMPYFYTADVDAKVAAIIAEGGAMHMPAADMPVGRIAMVSDPQGVPIYLMNPTPPADRPDAASDVFDPVAAQRVRWNELASPDQSASMDFYARHFGFAYPDKMPMGEMGDYCFISHHGQTLGAIMRKQAPSGPTLWLPYFGVPSIEGAKRAVLERGGQVVMGPHEVPGGDLIIVGIDPGGATFGLVGPQGE